MHRSRPTRKSSPHRPPAFTGDIRDSMGRFKPGHSGNPSGKPPGSISIAALIKAELRKVPPGQSRSWGDALKNLVVGRAMAGDPKMIDLVLRYGGSEIKESLRSGDGNEYGPDGKKPSNMGLPGESGDQLTPPSNGGIVSRVKGRKITKGKKGHGKRNKR